LMFHRRKNNGKNDPVMIHSGKYSLSFHFIHDSSVHG
jgi:hypothetical protein